MSDEVIRTEFVKENTSTKTTYFVRDNELDFEIRSKVVFNKQDKMVVYPFKKRDEELIQKYPSVKSIEFIGFNKRMPLGIRPTFKTGYGFTKDLSYIIYFLKKNFENVNKIIISKNSPTTKIKNKVFYINSKDLEKIRKQLSSILGVFRGDRKIIINNFFAKICPADIKKITAEYTKGCLNNILRNKTNILKRLSSEDKEEVFGLFKKLSFMKKNEINAETIITTKKLIDQILIEEVDSEFKKLLESKRRNEEKWQDFFNRNSWIFSQIFAYPMVVLKGKGYVGGNTIDNSNSKIADFIYKNKISQNVALVEIKTHLAKLVKKKPYRGDDVFEIEKELNGAINQILNQKDNLDKEYYALAHKSKEEFYSYNPKCFVIIGKLAQLTKVQKKSFELFRSSCKDVEIITFDELYERINLLLKIFEKKKNNKNETRNFTKNRKS